MWSILRYRTAMHHRRPLSLRTVIAARHLSYTSFPRLVFSVIRLPLAIGASAAAAVGYAATKMEELKKNIMPSWLQDVIQKTSDYLHKKSEHDRQDHSSSNQQNGGKYNASETPNPPISDSNDRNNNNDDDDGEEDIYDSVLDGNGQEPHALMHLTKKLIEIRSLLKEIDKSNTTITLPSIVVIGSQSSGKSSVLESIVGQEFLPKGSNMVTRRPIELTLIHTPLSRKEYAEFPQLGLTNISDFNKVQQTLTDLNLAVPESECVSSIPIELKIYSPRVPDLTMIDLPGYIQIHNKNQPPILRKKIHELVDKYIQEPNIILAVCAADVDLANAEALRASKRVDPQGIRTIGVITKLDLVPENVGVHLLKDNDYPLALGYVGVVCKTSDQNKVLSTSSLTKRTLRKNTAILSDSSTQFFSKHPAYLTEDIHTGSKTLRKHLVHALEHHLSKNMSTLTKTIAKALSEAKYQFKVQCNDRTISPEAYVASTLDVVKEDFKIYIVGEIGREQVREECRRMFADKVLQICEEMYWSQPGLLSEMQQSCLLSHRGNNKKNEMDSDGSRSVWKDRLDAASASLTKSGIGEATSDLIAKMLTDRMIKILETNEFKYHASAKEKILKMCKDLIESKHNITVDQVENTIKPYKYEVELNQIEWMEASKRVKQAMEVRLNELKDSFKHIQQAVGRKKLRAAMHRLEQRELYMKMTGRQDVNEVDPAEISRLIQLRQQNNYWTSMWSWIWPSSSIHVTRSSSANEGKLPLSETSNESSSSYPLKVDDAVVGDKVPVTIADAYQSNMYHRAKEALEIQRHIQLLESRMASASSRPCQSLNNQNCCPEVYLTAVSEKLTYTATMFIWIELLNEFMYQVPRILDSQIFYAMNKEQIMKIANENPEIERHLKLQKRKEILEKVMEKLKSLQS